LGKVLAVGAIGAAAVGVVGVAAVGAAGVGVAGAVIYHSYEAKHQDHSPLKLKIHVIGASSLQSGGEAYVHFHQGHVTAKTSARPKDHNPVWEEDILFGIVEKDVAGGTLHIEVLDKSLLHDSDIGKYEIPLAEIPHNQPKLYDVHLTGGHHLHAQDGHLKFTLCYASGPEVQYQREGIMDFQGAPPPQGGPPQQGGYPPQGYPPQGYPPQGYPQQGGYPPQGYPPQGYPPQQGGYPPQGYPPQGYPQQGGYPPQGYPPQGYPPQGYPQQGGYPPQGYPPQGYPPQQ